MTMKVALPIWTDRISPVLDVARQLLLVDVEDGAETGRREVHVGQADFVRKAEQVAGLGVDVIICGAVSRPLKMMLECAQVRVISHRCGPVNDVLQAFIADRLTDQAFLMPGCCGRREQFQGGTFEGDNRPGKEVIDMPKGDGTGPQGRGPGTGRALGSCGADGAVPQPGQQVFITPGRGGGIGQGRRLGGRGNHGQRGQGRASGRGRGR